MGVSFEPVGSIICVRPDPIPEDKGAIITPDKYRVQPVTGTVVVAGAYAPACYTPGVRILYGKYAGTLARIGDDIILMIDASEVLSIVEHDLPIELAV
jgi:co-chaperonin GroES (HSP10)